MVSHGKLPQGPRDRAGRGASTVHAIQPPSVGRRRGPGISPVNAGPCLSVRYPSTVQIDPSPPRAGRPRPLPFGRRSESVPARCRSSLLLSGTTVGPPLAARHAAAPTGC